MVQFDRESEVRIPIERTIRGMSKTIRGLYYSWRPNSNSSWDTLIAAAGGGGAWASAADHCDGGNGDSGQCSRIGNYDGDFNSGGGAFFSCDDTPCGKQGFPDGGAGGAPISKHPASGGWGFGGGGAGDGTMDWVGASGGGGGYCGGTGGSHRFSDGGGSYIALDLLDKFNGREPVRRNGVLTDDPNHGYGAIKLHRRPPITCPCWGATNENTDLETAIILCSVTESSSSSNGYPLDYTAYNARVFQEMTVTVHNGGTGSCTIGSVAYEDISGREMEDCRALMETGCEGKELCPCWTSEVPFADQISTCEKDDGSNVVAYDAEESIVGGLENAICFDDGQELKIHSEEGVSACASVLEVACA